MLKKKIEASNYLLYEILTVKQNMEDDIWNTEISSNLRFIEYGEKFNWKWLSKQLIIY